MGCFTSKTARQQKRAEATDAAAARIVGRLQGEFADTLAQHISEHLTHRLAHEVAMRLADAAEAGKPAPLAECTNAPTTLKKKKKTKDKEGRAGSAVAHRPAR